MGFGGNAKREARTQQEFNRGSMADAQRFNQINQQTPWGSTTYSGAPGSAGRTQTVGLDPADQQNLDSRRAITSQILGAILGGQGGGMQQGKQGGGGEQMPQMQQPQYPQGMPPQAQQNNAADRWGRTGACDGDSIRRPAQADEHEH